MEFEGKLSSAEGQRELKREQVIERAVADDGMEKRKKKERKRGVEVQREEPNLNGSFKRSPALCSSQ